MSYLHRNRLALAATGILVLVLALIAADLPASLRVWSLRSMGTTQLETLVRRNPEDLEARYQLGLTYARGNRHVEATREFLSVLARDPARHEVLNDLGASYLLQERYYEALVALQGALLAKPDSAVAYANLGRLHLATRMPFTAVRELEKSVQLDGRKATVHCDLGEAYQRTLNVNGALRSYQRAIQVDPKNLQARVGLGKAYFSLTRYQEAEAEFKRALEIDPSYASALLSLGRMKLEQGVTRADWEAAQPLLTRAAELDPADPEARFDLGRVHLRLKQPDRAVEHLVRALQLSPEHPGATHQLSRALRLAGREADADRVERTFREMALNTREESRLEERVHQQPNDWNSLAKLAGLYIRSGKTSLAALMCQRLEHGAPGHEQLPALNSALRQAAARAEVYRKQPSGAGPSSRAESGTAGL